ncbi:MAG: hypothetical protein IPL83_10485 [Bdellovibrionales bacterium]|jgi:uncharacterized Fe-S cluster-containing radical SAM superfamily protein|nr:hypothetical protein [Bdellovibrionales bacterium]
MILKASGDFHCTPGFANEAIDISSEHGVDVIKILGVRPILRILILMQRLGHKPSVILLRPKTQGAG